MADVIVNKVAESGLISFDLETLYPQQTRKVFDLKDHLFMGLILKEKDFRAALLQIDWNEYKDAAVAITCSADAIIPMWAYMLVASYLEPVASSVFFGTEEQMTQYLLLKNKFASDKQTRNESMNPNDIPRALLEGSGEEVQALTFPYVR